MTRCHLRSCDLRINQRDVFAAHPKNLVGRRPRGDAIKTKKAFAKIHRRDGIYLPTIDGSNSCAPFLVVEVLCCHGFCDPRFFCLAVFMLPAADPARSARCHSSPKVSQ